MPLLLVLAAVTAVIPPASTLTDVAHAVVSCPKHEDGEIVVCGDAGSSRYRLPIPTPNKKDELMHVRWGKLVIGGGGPKGAVGITLKLPF